VTLVRRAQAGTPRIGNVARAEFVRGTVAETLPGYQRGEFDIVTVRYTPLLADVVSAGAGDAKLGPAAWTAYLAFDHSNPITSNVEFRRALAHSIDREALAKVVASNMVVATGGLVPPALQGHTPDIALRFEPERAREHFERAGINGSVTLAAQEDHAGLVAELTRSWRETLGLDVDLASWSWRTSASPDRFAVAQIVIAGWLPGYQDPEYYLRLLLQSTSRTNEGGFADPAFDLLIERARQERSDRERLALFHEADRYAVADRVALIPLVYGRSMAFVKPHVHGWWEFGKTSTSFADLRVDE
jgi:oligopeptide transport system substrate-binding protein